MRRRRRSSYERAAESSAQWYWRYFGITQQLLPASEKVVLTPAANRHQSMMDVACTVAHFDFRVTVPEGPKWTASSAASSMRFPAWYGLHSLTGTSTSSINAGASTRTLGSANPMAGAGTRWSTPKTCLDCSNAGDLFWLLASQVKWKRACGASTVSTAGSCSALLPWPTHPGIS